MLHRRTARPPRRPARRSLPIGVALVGALALAACGSDSGTLAPHTTASTPGTTGVSDPPPAEPHAGRGWLAGEPDWDAMPGGDAEGDAMPAMAPRVDDALPVSEAGTAEASGGPASGHADGAGPGVQPAAPLRAGSVDDNADFAGFLEYLQRYEQLGLDSRPYDPTGRIVATVTGANGLPVSGATVSVAAAGAPVAQLQTSADGQVIFLPAEYGAVHDGYTLTSGDVHVDALAGTEVSMVLPADGGASPGMPVDVLFLLDVTGSMGDEIAQLKATIAQVSDQLRALPQQPDIRFGMTLFRDEGDLFVTSTYDFTGDIAAFQEALEQVEADGGGDTPEAVDEAFAAGLSEPSWRDAASTVQLVFLVGDAAPQVHRQVEQAYPESIQEASSRGITVHVVAASQTDDPAEHAFRQIAQGTGGRFVFLAYGAAGTATGEHTDIASTDYEELSLDQLVVRLVGEELAALTGESFVPPSTVPTVPTTDQQQGR